MAKRAREEDSPPPQPSVKARCIDDNVPSITLFPELLLTIFDGLSLPGQVPFLCVSREWRERAISVIIGRLANAGWLQCGRHAHRKLSITHIKHNHQMYMVCCIAFRDSDRPRVVLRRAPMKRNPFGWEKLHDARFETCLIDIPTSYLYCHMCHGYSTATTGHAIGNAWFCGDECVTQMLARLEKLKSASSSSSSSFEADSE